MEIETIGLICAILVLLYLIITNGITYYKTTYSSDNGKFNKIKFEQMFAQYLYIMIIILIIILIVAVAANPEVSRKFTFGSAKASAKTGAATADALEKAKAAGAAAKSIVSSYPIIIMGCLIVFSIGFWGVDKMTLNERNCTIMDASDKKTSTSSYITSPSNIEAAAINPLYNYYIKTAYNCCCPGNYKNDYVNICALKNCLQYGARCLDFEIYSVQNQPVISVSSVTNFTIKETYNALPFIEAMQLLRDYAFSSSCPCNKDPIFLNFRIKSKNQNIYNQMAKDLSNTLATYLLGKKYSYQYKNEGSISNFGRDVKLAELQEKVVIMVDDSTALFVDTPLEEYINISTNSGFMQTQSFTTIKSSSNIEEDYIEYNKNKMTLCLPDLSSKPFNYDSSIPIGGGCQFVAMCFQKPNANLEYYNQTFFNNSSIKMKPDELQEQVVILTLPPCIDSIYQFQQPDTTFAGIGQVAFAM